LLVAVVAGMFCLSFSWLSLILLVMGILAAIMFLDSDSAVNAGIRYLVLASVAGAQNSLPFVGSFLTGMFTAVVVFLALVVLTLLVVYIVKKYFVKEVNTPENGPAREPPVSGGSQYLTGVPKFLLLFLMIYPTLRVFTPSSWREETFQ